MIEAQSDVDASKKVTVLFGLMGGVKMSQMKKQG